MKAFWHRLANKIFYQKTILSYLLLPFSWVYLLIISIHKFLYRQKILKTYHFSIPIIVIGNLTVGGTGKTPLTIFLANFLKAQGFKPAIISRGYGGQAPQYPYPVDANSTPEIVGDEAVLIARQTQCPMVIAPKRVAALQYILQQYACDIVLADDGLQHHALGRDIEMVVIDGQRRFGNGFCLPAGPLRESISRLQTVDFLICNGAAAKNDEYSMTYMMNDLHAVDHSSRVRPLAEFRNKTIHAVAGIGNPERFFNYLRENSLTIIPHIFPDHHPYQVSDFSFIGKDDQVIMTEKDAVKCEKFAKENFWYLPIKADLPKDFEEKLLQSIKVRSSNHENH